MATIRRVADDVYQIHPKLNFMFSLSYLVVGERSALIDPGSTAQAKTVLQALERQLEFDFSSLSYIIPTHLHVDHSGGTGYMAERVPDCRVVVYQRHARHLRDPEKLINAYKRSFGDDFADKFGEVMPVSESRVLTVEDGDTIELGGRSLKIIHTGGHAGHHICIYDDVTEGLFCGDALGMYFPAADDVVVVCPEGFDLHQQLQSIERIRGMNPTLLFYAHEGVAEGTDHLTRRAVRELKECGEITLNAFKQGENTGQVEGRLKDYFLNNVSGELDYDRMHLDLTVAGYRGYYEKLGWI
ncbi:MAG: MBL fold metallo-hydrolase [Dehalococcoidia bacterium]